MIDDNPRKQTRFGVSKTNRSICSLLFQFVILIVCFCVVIWLSITPHTSVYKISDAYVNNSNSTLYHGTESSVNLTHSITLILDIHNPNEGFNAYYDYIDLTLYNSSDSVVIAYVYQPGFYQQRGFKTKFVHEVNVDDEKFSEGSAMIRAGVRTVVRYGDKIFGLKTGRRHMDFEANIVVSKLNGSIFDDKNITMHKMVKMNNIS